MKEIESDSTATQRLLSQKLGISLGKTNYLLRELIKKGFIEVRNFSSNPEKIKKITYILTKKGFEHKIQLVGYFLRIKESEYNHMKQEWDKIQVSEAHRLSTDNTDKGFFDVLA